MEAGVYQAKPKALQETSEVDQSLAAKDKKVSTEPSEIRMELSRRGTKHMEIRHSI